MEIKEMAVRCSTNGEMLSELVLLCYTTEIYLMKSPGHTDPPFNPGLFIWLSDTLLKDCNKITESFHQNALGWKRQKISSSSSPSVMGYSKHCHIAVCTSSGNMQLSRLVQMIEMEAEISCKDSCVFSEVVSEWGKGGCKNKAPGAAFRQADSVWAPAGMQAWWLPRKCRLFSRI